MKCDRISMLCCCRYASKNYGLVIMGQAVAAPITAILTQFLSPLVGWFGMFCVIGTCSFSAAVLNLIFFPKNPESRKILERMERPAPSQI